MICKTSIISEGAILGNNISIGEYSIIESNVNIADNSVIGAFCKINSGTAIGKDNYIGDYCVLGTLPNLKGFDRHCHSNLLIGNNNVINDNTVIARAKVENSFTKIGDGNHLGHGSYIGHDAKIGNNNVISAYARISGFSCLNDSIHVGMGAFVHQFSKIGPYVMIGALSKVVRDIPPYFLADGNPAEIKKVNKVGLLRNGFSQQEVSEIEEIFFMLKDSSYPEISDMDMQELKNQFIQKKFLAHIIDFYIKSERGCMRFDN